ncbi:hypothetical protein DCAR_0103037 [Daucus carota subsp. sativus]|uniref:Uncharacterized protein n=1 Tax=Daucus carota subsp. sativus TaxID=79200 RepID=A0A166HGU4_DAUCS|nr:hypothetical protein DCAR_0103037 [Daucus carota subsp. sativus]
MGGGPRIVHEKLRGPNLVKEIAVAATMGLVIASFWKYKHWEMKNTRRQFYDMLDRGEVSVVIDE